MLQTTYMENANLDVVYEYDVDGNVLYEGVCEPGRRASTELPIRGIRKFFWDASTPAKAIGRQRVKDSKSAKNLIRDDRATYFA